MGPGCVVPPANPVYTGRFRCGIWPSTVNRARRAYQPCPTARWYQGRPVSDRVVVWTTHAGWLIVHPTRRPVSGFIHQRHRSIPPCYSHDPRTDADVNLSAPILKLGVGVGGAIYAANSAADVIAVRGAMEPWVVGFLDLCGMFFGCYQRVAISVEYYWIQRQTPATDHGLGI